MKPVKLIMTAFGPYAEKQTIDFTELGSRSMFVVSGKTGSGKTTIFDAICFAVYGKPSGDKRSASEMRSQFAHFNMQTEVELTFELRGRLYTIRRKPQQEKPKARGNGTTIVTASAELMEYTKEGKERMLTANVRDTDEKIHELIGLEANQFRQILMIPQGEFQKLLFSSSQDKEKILQKLFHTAFYKSVEEKLKERADALKKQAGRAMDQQWILLKSLPAYSAEMKALLDQEEGDKEKIFLQLDRDVHAMQAALQSKQALIQQQSKKRDELLNDRERSRAVNEQFEKLEQLSAYNQKLEEQEEMFSALKTQINQGERAEKLIPYEEMAEQAALSMQEAFLRQEQASESAKKLQEQWTHWNEKWQQQQRLQPERDELLEKKQYLEQIQPSVKAFDAAAEQEKAANDLLQKAAETKKQLVEQEQLLIKQIEALENRLEPLQTAKERLLAAQQQSDNLTRQQEQWTEWMELQQEHHSLKQEEQAAEQAAEQIQKHADEASSRLVNLKKKLKLQEAAALAQELEAGKPCFVCGSIHHPSPAVYKSNELLEEAEEVEQTVASLFALQAKQKQKKASLEFAADRLQKQMEKSEKKLSDYSLADISQMLQAVKSSQAKAEADLNEKKQVNKKLQEEKEMKKEIESQLTRIRQLEAEKQAAYAEAKAELSQLRKTVPESLRQRGVFDRVLRETAGQYEEKITLFEQTKQSFQSCEANLQTALSVLSERKQVMQKAEQASQQAEAVLAAKQKEAGFTEEEFKAAKSLLAGISKSKESVTVFEKQKQETKSRLQELTKALSGKNKQVLHLFDEQLAEMDEQLAAWTAEAGRINAQIEESARIRSSVQAAAAQLALVEQEYRLSGHLYDVAHGKNELKVTFERYVLASFLEDILVAANSRLAAMTNGRFILERQKERAKGNAQSGLDLLVFDHYTGTSRTVKTLSGGESFKAALALALGLAEVVQNFAGGVSLETMFVDEGFGTLDPESLDQAIETLLDIQADGRLVGIISHVPELKERIDARLEVYQSEKGSKAAFLFTGEAL